MKKSAKGLLRTFIALIVLLPMGAAGLRVWTIAHPGVENLPLPATLLAHDSSGASSLPSTPETAVDLVALSSALQGQETRTGCGPATAATVLSALKGRRVSQDDVFSDEAVAQRPQWKTFLGGMPLEALAAMLRTHGIEAETVHAGASSVEVFRDAVRRNESTPGDFLVVNFLRTGLGQQGGGHFSPVGAYDAASDRVLILDVAVLRYPPVWAPLVDLFTSMDTVDSQAGLTRGWIEVRQGAVRAAAGPGG